MPNWCNCVISIHGPESKIRALWDDAQQQMTQKKGLLNAMVPLGEWTYQGALQEWGTKWDISTEGLEFVQGDDNTATIQGWADSAWSPPLAAFESYCEENSDVYAEVRYFEPGENFIGIWTSVSGDDCWDSVHNLLNTTSEEDPGLYSLLEQFGVWDLFGDEQENSD